MDNDATVNLVDLPGTKCDFAFMAEIYRFQKRLHHEFFRSKITFFVHHYVLKYCHVINFYRYFVFEIHPLFILSKKMIVYKVLKESLFKTTKHLRSLFVLLISSLFTAVFHKCNRRRHLDSPGPAICSLTFCS